ncbi:MAG: hypothetical protein ACK5Y8_04150 [Betaproteobacteria bacterium]|nr:hypothetical protein [Rubrivivax sp.]
MRSLLSTTLALAAAALLGGCATEPATPVPVGALRMEAQDIRSLLGRPIRLDNGVRGGLTYRFAPDGTVEYGMRMFAVRKAGTWRTDDKGLCVRVENDPWICGRFYRLGSGRFYFDVPQHGQDYNTLTIRD